MNNEFKTDVNDKSGFRCTFCENYLTNEERFLKYKKCTSCRMKENGLEGSLESDEDLDAEILHIKRERIEKLAGTLGASYINGTAHYTVNLKELSSSIVLLSTLIVEKIDKIEY